MNSLQTLRTRVNYAGGRNQEGRMNKGKLQTLKRALLYSYQSATAILSDGREFRCLINPDKLKTKYDEKIISIPFRDICLNRDPQERRETTQDEEDIDIKPGDVFTWKETNTNWLVYLRRYEETAYFRAEIRKCDYSIDLDGKKYRVYACGPSETSIIWNKVKGTMWNDLNYDITMYITKDSFTEDYFHRFTKITLNNKPWEVQAVDGMSQDGILIIALRETTKNTLEEQQQEEEKIKQEKEKKEIKTIYIEGDKEVYPYDVKKYIIKGAEGGKWEISNKKAQITSQNNKEVNLSITTSRSGDFNLIYKRENEEDIVLSIIIKSL